MKNYIYIFLFIFAIPIIAAEDFYSLSAKKINGDTLHFSELRGKKLMIVNVASLCGYTYQYAELQKLYEEFGGDNFEIIAFPANNFSNQEPGTDEDIEDFCKENYNVTFTMMSKISVKGFDKHSVYQWLTDGSINGQVYQEVMWNFQKYCITEEGKIWKIFSSQTSPLHNDIKTWLKQNVSIAENNDLNEIIAVYPNPANDFIMIDAIDTNDDVIIYNTLGIEQLRLNSPDATNGVHSINISALPAGTYIIRIGNQSKIFVKI
ncbi:MAG: T9SS type A sorting domain-containing protein [Candidatus Kapabacteria bacterium]|nr:T9SS type A sorting domain-containing protein [Ignavibacteriota bacterium]MCW5884551.1 T9SS type A sorting domain-containing protein [Candidatus Kapabacteria bacterium]